MPRLASNSNLHLLLGPALMTLASYGCQQADGPPAPLETHRHSTNVQRAAAVWLGQIQFVPDLEAGQRLAADLQAPALLFFRANWCQFCRQMESGAFCAERPVRLSEHFVCVLVDADRCEDVCRKFRVGAYPTIQILGPDGAPLDRLVGSHSAESLSQTMHAALQRLAWRSPPRTIAR